MSVKLAWRSLAHSDSKSDVEMLASDCPKGVRRNRVPGPFCRSCDATCLSSKDAIRCRRGDAVKLISYDLCRKH